MKETPSNPPAKSGHFWTFFIGLLFLYAFVAGGVFLYFAKTSYRGVVTSQAYKDALTFEEQLERQRKTQQAEIEVKIVEYSPQLLVRISRMREENYLPPELHYKALYLAEDGLEISGRVLRADSLNLYKLDQVLPRRGVWLLTIESIGSDGDPIFWKEQITLR